MPKIRVWICTNKVGSKCEDVVEYSDEEWEEMHESEREQELQSVVWNVAEWGYEVVDA